LPWLSYGAEGRFTVHDPDELARLAETDPYEAAKLLLTSAQPAPPDAECWVDGLAADLAYQPDLRLGDWAETKGFAPESLSRTFKRLFGASPRLFRLEARTRRSLKKIATTAEPLTSIAHGCGFADLAHMSRSIAALTGRSPSAWRKRILNATRQMNSSAAAKSPS
jgi:AraC-like DNA-binding protein